MLITEVLLLAQVLQPGVLLLSLVLLPSHVLLHSLEQHTDVRLVPVVVMLVRV